ncbi:hypothetical protein GCM10009087_30850 [Sphingomonas oligophenolica]|uniref:DUF2306 domain-containing protein n=1 Tax=Sphingomonas oligophenolica TaxID=301154 RepID=A0ABU9Y6N1_9SPHN
MIAGAVAMLSRKRRGRHADLGTICFWCLSGVFATMSVLSFMRWAANNHLLLLGALAMICACLGRTAARRRWRQQWPRIHLTGMGACYIAMLTAFYVDNGKNLPLWRDLPEIALGILPSAIGVPAILVALLRHPLARGLGRSGPSIAPSGGSD